jgi:uncharacterized protein YlxW (UPF0749 family)
MQLKLEQTTGSHAEQEKITDMLKNQIVELNAENEKLVNKLQEMNNKLEQVRDSAAQNDSSNAEKSELIKKYTIISGETDVYGPGIVIDYKIDDNSYTADVATDLRDIVNELKNAGAEAISINGERFYETTSIEMVKNKIEINGTQLNSPYVIKAIGDAETIYSSLTRPDGIIEQIKSNQNMKVNLNIDIVESLKILKKSEI